MHQWDMLIAIGDDLLYMHQDSPVSIGKQFFRSTLKHLSSAVNPESSAVHKIQEKATHLGIHQDVPDTHKCTISIEIRESEGFLINEFYQASSPTLKRAVTPALIITGCQEEIGGIFKTLLENLRNMVPQKLLTSF